jgi:hypothetical protein
MGEGSDRGLARAGCSCPVAVHKMARFVEGMGAGAGGSSRWRQEGRRWSQSQSRSQQSVAHLMEVDETRRGGGRRLVLG